MKTSRDRPPESYWLYALAGALLLGGPVWHYLFINRYPLRPEAIILPLLAALLGAAIAVAAQKVGGLVAGLVFGVLLYLWVDLQLDLDQSIRTIVVLAGCLALPLLLERRRALLTCLMLGAFNLAALPRPATASVPARAQPDARAPGPLPLLVHLVLDEQWGIGGLRAAGDTATARFLTDFYVQRGFEVYEGAYSRSDLTRISIPEAMSFGRPVDLEQVFAKRKPTQQFSLRANPYFERLREFGYSIHVYQSSHLDLCRSVKAAATSCETWTANSIANIGYVRGAWTGRARLAARYFLNATSHAYSRLKSPPDGLAWRQAVAGRGLAALGAVRDAIAAEPGRGSAVFVHVLLPHRPLEVDEHCRAYADPGRRVGYNLAEYLSDSSWHALLAQYSAQDRCVHGAVDEVLTALDRTVGRDGAIVLVHGDHGPRMSQHRVGAAVTASQLDPQQLNSLFSTLLAIRRPGVPAAIHPEAVPIQDFLWELVRKDFKGEVRAQWRHSVRHTWPELYPRMGTLRALTRADMLWARPLR